MFCTEKKPEIGKISIYAAQKQFTTSIRYIAHIVSEMDEIWTAESLDFTRIEIRIAIY